MYGFWGEGRVLVGKKKKHKKQNLQKIPDNPGTALFFCDLLFGALLLVAPPKTTRPGSWKDNVLYPLYV